MITALIVLIFLAGFVIGYTAGTIKVEEIETEYKIIRKCEREEREEMKSEDIKKKIKIAIERAMNYWSIEPNIYHCGENKETPEKIRENFIESLATNIIESEILK